MDTEEIINKEPTMLLKKRLKKTLLKQEDECMTVHRMGIHTFETNIFSEVDFENFLSSMILSYNELIVNHSSELKLVGKIYSTMKDDKEIIKTTLSCNSLNMLEYYELYVKKCKYFERTAIAELLYMAEWSQRNNLKRADKILQNSKRRIIFSTKSGIFWNSDVVHFDQFLSGIEEKYNIDLFMDTLLEIKRVHASTATDLAQNLLRLIRDFYLFEDDRNLECNDGWVL